MKRLIIIVVSVVMTVGSISAQNIFFANKEGMKLYYANLNAKGKVDSYSLQTIKKVEGSGDNMTIAYMSQVLDKNRKPTGSNPIEVSYTVVINNGVMEWDMKNFAAPGTEGFITFEGDKLRIPSSLAAGTKLDDVAFTLTLNMGIRITTQIMLTDMECVSVEDVTVPAGTFKCYKVTQQSTATVGRRSVITHSITWYSPGIGTVKTENYNDKNKLQTTTELHALEN